MRKIFNRLMTLIFMGLEALTIMIYSILRIALILILIIASPFMSYKCFDSWINHLSDNDVTKIFKI